MCSKLAERGTVGSTMRAKSAWALLSLSVAPWAKSVRAADFDPGEDRPLRVTVEAGLGVAGTVVGGFALGGSAYGVGTMLGADTDCKGGGHFCLPESAGLAVLGGLIGAVGGLGLGVWMGGYSMDGNGKLWAAYAGEGVGLATAIGLPLLLDSEDWIPITLLTLPLAGAIVGYEMSTSRQRDVATTSQPLVLGEPAPPLLTWSGVW